MRITKMIIRVLDSCVDTGLVKEYFKGAGSILVVYFNGRRERYRNKEDMMTCLANMSADYHSDDSDGE